MVFFGMNVIEVKGMEIRIELLGLMTTLIGPTNSGKTVFAKKLCNKIDNSDVFIDGKKITEYDIKYLRENIAVVLDDDNYENEFVYEELLCDKVLVKILALLLLSPKVFIVDNLLSYLKEDKRKLLLKYLKEKEISFINITTDAEEILFSDVVVVINNFKSVISGSPKSILEGNSILPYMGIKLPFIVDLSHNLILYNVVDKIYCDNRKLVDKLWK